MSRPIRYRAWDKKSKEYRIVKKIIFDYNGDIDFVVTVDKDTGHDPWDQTLDEIVLEQDTGFKDKNGKRICGGDIIRHKNGQLLRTIWNEKEGSWNYDLEPETFGITPLLATRDLWRVAKFCEVIGNIHENKDLLK